MAQETRKENHGVVNANRVLICIVEDLKGMDAKFREELSNLQKNFCGNVLVTMEDWNESSKTNNSIYFCGNVDKNIEVIKKHKMRVIRQLSTPTDYDCIVELGEVPLNIHNVGIYFRKLWSEKKDYFKLIKEAHKFQTLTESNKPSSAYRKGIYLTKVVDTDKGTKFNLLRCSTNFDGSTENLRDIDEEVISKVNGLSSEYFKDHAELNHVLAQIYENSVSTTEDGKRRERKAVIKSHSDKTKDMPENGLIAFTTFYEFDPSVPIEHSKEDVFDVCYNKQSVLTKLHFRLKEPQHNLVKEFTIHLYPNSVFIIPLSTNRLYTHEIRAPALPIDKIPTRMGYVIRCSKTPAIWKDGETFIIENGEITKLEAMTHDDMVKLKELYAKENKTCDKITYGTVNFSMNAGDYKKPTL